MLVRRLFRGLLLVAVLAECVHCEDTGCNTTLTAQKTYKEAEREIVNFAHEQLRSILPMVVGGGGSSRLSQRCMAGMMKIFGNIRKLKGWTLKILDSIGKPTAGILKGSSFSMGHYDQCVDLAVTSKGEETHNVSEAIFQGMYCKVKIGFEDVVVDAAKKYHRGHLDATELGKLKEIIQATPYVSVTSEYMSHFLGICLPSSCTLDDVQQLLNTVSFPGMATVQRCEIKSDEELNQTQMTVISIFLTLICLVCVSTFIDWLLHNKKGDKLSSTRDKRCVSMAVSFSIFNSTKRLVKNIEDDADNILAGHCVRGIVVASIAWIILGHTYLVPYDAFYMQSSSLENLRDYLSEAYFSYVVNSSLAIDALLVCYGFIMTYALWYNVCRAQDVKIDVFRLILCNYLRICIPVLICLGIVVLLPIIGSGPFWNDVMDSTISKCYKNYGAYLEMYSNFLDREEQCFPHLWFTSCLAQLTLVGVILAWILSRNTRVGIAVIILLALASNIAVGVYTFNNEFQPSYVAYFSEGSTDLFWKVNFSLAPAHFGPYALGMLTGTFVARRSNLRLKPVLSIIGWLLCICMLVGLMVFIYRYHVESMGNFWSSVYAGSHRTLFAICVAWVIAACSFGNGGFVNAILSWRVFDPLFRLSYYAYVMHFIIISFHVAVAREHFYYSHQELIPRAVTYITVTYFLSYLLYVMLEMPMKTLFCSLCPKRSNQINLTSVDNLYPRKGNLQTPDWFVSGSCKLWSVSNSKNHVAY